MTGDGAAENIEMDVEGGDFMIVEDSSDSEGEETMEVRVHFSGSRTSI